MKERYRLELIRLGIIVALPVFVVWAFCETLGRECWNALRTAWLDVRAEIEIARIIWRTGRLP